MLSYLRYQGFKMLHPIFMVIDFGKIFQEGFQGYVPPPANRGINITPGTLTIETIVSTLLPYVLVISGLILFGLLIAGGFGMLTSAGNPESAQKAQKQITSAVIGFLIVFLAFWIVQILQKIFGVTLLG